jgi:DNA-directed RNA polymerase subunit RPC12/RpoP
MSAANRDYGPPANLRFTFSCKRCGCVLEATAEQVGRQARCPTCGGVFSVPEVDPRTGVAQGMAEVAEDGQLPTPMHAYATAGQKAPRIVRLDDGDQRVECPRCRRQSLVESNVCSGCGLPFTLEGAEEAVSRHQQDDSFANAALVAGILSLLTFCLPLPAPIAIWLGVVSIRRSKRMGPSRTGLRRGILAIVCGLISGMIYAIWFT